MYIPYYKAQRGSSYSQLTGTADRLTEVIFIGICASQHKQHVDKKNFGYLQLLIYFFFLFSDDKLGK